MCPQLRELLSAQVKALLEEDIPSQTAGGEPSQPQEGGRSAPAVAAALAMVVWPALPPTSPHHVSVALGLLQDCISDLPSEAAHTSSLPQRLTKLRDLMDKAGGAVRGLAVRPLVTPLLRPLLSQLKLPPPPTFLLLTATTTTNSADKAGVSSGGKQPPANTATNAPLPPGGLCTPSQADAAAPPGGPAAPPDPELQALVSDAQAAVYTYVTPASVGAAAKLIKALQVRRGCACIHLDAHAPCWSKICAAVLRSVLCCVVRATE